MVVDVMGNEDSPSFIRLPGWGCTSLVLEFWSLAKRLPKEFRSITIESFGHGLSDGTEKETDLRKHCLGTSLVCKTAWM